ncbi:MAG: DNA-deoxyinosine glycosylase [Lentisphaerae bacterium]|nr:DNA-deoxyinosine glycosylase [Lentisphaerota bacterium]
MTTSRGSRRGRTASPAVSFPPVARRDARVLLLGTMPGVASLAAREYYAHPRNAFWGILAARTGVPASAPYARRCAGLRRARIALWDVARACRRAGSLDADIDPASVIPNDIAGLLARCPGIRAILFNGGPAERLFRLHVAPRLGPRGAAIPTARLPSTSPAHASRTAADKRRAWLAHLDAALFGAPDCDRMTVR